MIRQIITITSCVLPLIMNAQLLIQRQAEMHIDYGAEVIVEGGLVSEENIEGKGTVILTNTRTQDIDMHGHFIPKLMVLNDAVARLTSPLAIREMLVLEKSQLYCGDFDISLASNATVEGDAGGYITTDGAGRVVKFIDKQLTNFKLPVGNKGLYTPLDISTSGWHRNGSVSVQALAHVNPNKPTSSNHYLNHYWQVDSKGISGGLTAHAEYSGSNTSSLQPQIWHRGKWKAANNSAPTAAGYALFDIPDGQSQLYAMESNDPALIRSLDISPNPVVQTAKLLIQSYKSEQAIISVVDVNGETLKKQVVQIKKGVNVIELDVSTLAKGSYNISWNSGNGRITKSILKI